jgi:hypothetical protein
VIFNSLRSATPLQTLAATLLEQKHFLDLRNFRFFLFFISRTEDASSKETQERWLHSVLFFKSPNGKQRLLRTGSVSLLLRFPYFPSVHTYSSSTGLPDFSRHSISKREKCTK